MRSFALLALLACTLGIQVSCAHRPISVQTEAIGKTFYTRHTMFGEQQGPLKAIYRSNFLAYTDLLAAGSEAKITDYTSQYVEVTIDGIPCRILYKEIPFAIGEAGVDRFVAKHFAADRAAIGLDKVSENSKSLIERGRAAIGMSKHEVFLAIGYPAYIDGTTPTADLDAERIFRSKLWTYRVSQLVFFPATVWKYQFDSDGKLYQRDPP